MVMAPLVMMPWVMMLETVVMVRMTKAGSGEADDGREDADDGAADNGGGGVDVDERGQLLVDGRLGYALKTGPTSGRNLGHEGTEGKGGGYRTHIRKGTAKVSQGNVGRKPVSARLCRGYHGSQGSAVQRSCGRLLRFHSHPSQTYHLVE